MNALTSASEMVFKFIQLFNCIVLVETTHLTQVECYMYIRMSFDGLECSTVGNLGSWANGIEWPEWPYRAEVPAVTVITFTCSFTVYDRDQRTDQRSTLSQ